MPEPKQELRTKRMVVRVTATEERALKAGAEKARLNPTDYIRVKALDHSRDFRTTPVVSVDQKMLCKALGVLGGVGSELRRIIDLLAIGEMPYRAEVNLAVKKIEEASDAILTSLGAK